MVLLLKQFLLNSNLYFTNTTNINQLLYFFKQIRPITTNKPLIRIGGESDSGYLIPDDLNNIKVCFSPGVSNSSSFESDLGKYGIESYLADLSVDSPPVQSNRFHFIKKFIGFENRPDFVSLENWLKMYEGYEKDDDMILQMDIEGDEYNVIISADNTLLRKFRIMVIEFHFLDLLLCGKSFGMISSCFFKLLKDFHIVHIHPNNCTKLKKYKQFEIPPVMEFTFLRKDRIGHFEYSNKFPHPLDRKNIAYLQDVILPRCFYSYLG